MSDLDHTHWAEPATDEFVQEFDLDQFRLMYPNFVERLEASFAAAFTVQNIRILNHIDGGTQTAVRWEVLISDDIRKSGAAIAHLSAEVPGARFHTGREVQVRGMSIIRHDGDDIKVLHTIDWSRLQGGLGYTLARAPHVNAG